MSLADETLTDIGFEKESCDDVSNERMIQLLKDSAICLEESRLKTFKNWPFSEPDKCTPEAVGMNQIFLLLLLLLLLLLVLLFIIIILSIPIEYLCCEVFFFNRTTMEFLQHHLFFG